MRLSHRPDGCIKAGQGQPDPLPRPHPYQLCCNPCGSFLPLPQCSGGPPSLGDLPQPPLTSASAPHHAFVLPMGFHHASQTLRGSEALEWPPPSTPTQPEATKVWCSCHFPYPKSKPEFPFAHGHARSPTRQGHTWACSTTLHSHWSLGPTEPCVSRT